MTLNVMISLNETLQPPLSVTLQTTVDEISTCMQGRRIVTVQRSLMKLVCPGTLFKCLLVTCGMAYVGSSLLSAIVNIISELYTRLYNRYVSI